MLPYLRQNYKTLWFSRLLGHRARKRSGPVFSNPKPERGFGASHICSGSTGARILGLYVIVVLERRTHYADVVICHSGLATCLVPK